MNEQTIILRKEYVDTSIELINQSISELEEIKDIFLEKQNLLEDNKDYQTLKLKNKDLSNFNIKKILEEITLETKENRDLLETFKSTIEEYNRLPEPTNYTNPNTSSSFNPSIKNASTIAAITGIAAATTATIISETKEKSEE